MSRSLERLTVSIMCFCVLASQIIFPATSEAAAAFKIGVDNKQASGAGEGSVVTGFNPDTPTVGIRNTHQFWTTLVVQAPSGPITLKPSPLSQDAGGVYAALGVVGPGAQASWTVEVTSNQAASESVVITPADPGRKYIALGLNILTVALTMLGASSVVTSPDAMVGAVTLMQTTPEFNDAVQAMQEQDIVAFAQDFYKILSDPTKKQILVQAFSKMGVLVSKEALQRILILGNILELGRMVFDEARVWIDGTANGVVTFTTTPTSASIPRSALPVGNWMQPSDGSSVASGMVHFAAHAGPRSQDDPAVDHVNFLLWWVALGPKTGAWKLACTAKPPATGDIFQCDADFATLGIPPGDVSARFDVYDRAGDVSRSSDGLRSITYRPNLQSAASPAPQTRVIIFRPPNDVPGPEYSGNCWIGSVVTPSNPNAWRCNGKDGIGDPCFGVSPSATFVICSADPAHNIPGYKLRLTAPLPARGIPPRDDPWIIQLTDGTSCTFFEGAPVMITATKEFVRNGCTDGSSLINIRQGAQWTADKVVLTPVPGGGYGIRKSVSVTISTVWR